MAAKSKGKPIVLTWVSGSSGNRKRDRTFTYKTLTGARHRAALLVGRCPKRDPDGYAVNRRTGECLFIRGTTFEYLFPDS